MSVSGTGSESGVGDDGVETLVIDGSEVAFRRDEEAGVLRVSANGREVGTLELVATGGGFTARRASGEALTRYSQWGGQVTARFQTRELAARALLSAFEARGLPRGGTEQNR